MNKTTAFDIEYLKQILDRKAGKRPWERGCRQEERNNYKENKRN